MIGPVREGNVDIVKVLLEAGEDPDRSGEHGQTALFLAMKQGQDEMKDLLLEYGADVEIVTFLTKLDDAEEEARLAAEEKRKEEEEKAKNGPKTFRARKMTAELEEVSSRRTHLMTNKYCFRFLTRFRRLLVLMRPGTELVTR